MLQALHLSRRGAAAPFAMPSIEISAARFQPVEEVAIAQWVLAIHSNFDFKMP
jgi:hypothetical protein